MRFQWLVGMATAQLIMRKELIDWKFSYRYLWSMLKCKFAELITIEKNANELIVLVEGKFPEFIWTFEM